MSGQVHPPLPQGAGYGVVVGFGVAFALGMIWVTKALKKSFNEDNKSTETFMVANRTVGTGLTASAVISSWLYSTALLGASLLTYRYGLALGVWWGASASTMVCFLSLLAIEAKRRAPNAHTLLELIRVRYGTFAHLLWIVFCLLTNVLNFTGMLLGASAAVTSLTGMDVIASTYLLPGFSADVAAAVPGYVLGGVASFSVPWTVGTFGGLAAVALESTPAFPTYPRLMTTEEVSSGLVLPYVVQAVTGAGGAGALINEKATDKQLIRWSHIGVVVTSLVIPSLATAFDQGGVDMTWLLYVVGNITNPGCFPTIFALLWKGQTKAAAITAPIVGVCCAVSVWLGTAYAYFGEISIASTGSTMPSLFGCVTAFFVPLPVSLLVSLARPSSFEWSVFRRQIKKVRQSEGEKAENQEDPESWFTPERKQYMKKMTRWAIFWTIFTLLGHFFLWPFAMYGAKMVFSKSLFTAWIVVSLIYLFFTLLVSNIYPLYDGGIRKIWTVVTGRASRKGETSIEGQLEASDGSSDTPPAKQASVETKVLEA